MSDPRSRTYFERLDHNDPQFEHWRSLEHEWDNLTIRRLVSLGISESFRCADIGAGLGSIAHWMAERVGPTGHVVACDLNPRYLDPQGRRNFEVRKLDITSDELEAEAYDLIHCRSLLIHIGDPAMAIKRMVRALRPGGRLLLEEGCGYARANPSHSRADFFDEINQRFRKGIEKLIGVKGNFGLRLPSLLEDTGLHHIGGEMIGHFHMGSTDLSPFITLAKVVRTPLINAGILTEAELDECIALYQNPSFSYAAGQMAGLGFKGKLSNQMKHYTPLYSRISTVLSQHVTIN
ncbi:MAG: methyltransferase domain-containing protein [Chlamydiales bacterium]|nr:methyltransferase domain-containing protein [Chlamydiales bacterium]